MNKCRIAGLHLEECEWRIFLKCTTVKGSEKQIDEYSNGYLLLVIQISKELQNDTHSLLKLWLVEFLVRLHEHLPTERLRAECHLAQATCVRRYRSPVKHLETVLDGQLFETLLGVCCRFLIQKEDAGRKLATLR